MRGFGDKIGEEDGYFCLGKDRKEGRVLTGVGGALVRVNPRVDFGKTWGERRIIPTMLGDGQTGKGQLFRIKPHLTKNNRI